VKFWVDAQLPPQLAAWLAAEFQVEANSLRDLGLRDAADLEIFQQARQPGIVLISKDSDFVDMVSRFGPPPQLLWVTGSGNRRDLLIAQDNGLRGEIETLDKMRARV